MIKSFYITNKVLFNFLHLLHIDELPLFKFKIIFIMSEHLKVLFIKLLIINSK